MDKTKLARFARVKVRRVTIVRVVTHSICASHAAYFVTLATGGVAHVAAEFFVAVAFFAESIVREYELHEKRRKPPEMEE